MQRRPKAPSAEHPHRHRPVLGLAAAVLAIAAFFGAGQATADTAPTPTIAAPSNVQYSTAHLSGEVNPNGGPSITHWRFEWSTDQSNWTQGQDHELSEAQSAESTPIPVEEDISGLSASTTYFLRLAASNEGGENLSAEVELTTKGPVSPPNVTIDAPSLISAQNGSFAFTGHVNPNGTDPAFETHWRFDCEPSCGNPPGGTIAADESSHLVEAEVEGLEAKTTYTVTLHATNAGGEATAQATFKTPAGPPILGLFATLTELDRSITIRGFVNSRHSAIDECHFAYGPTEGYGNSVPCTITENFEDEVRANLPVASLTPGAKYHFHLFATTQGGSAKSADGTFEALSAPASEACPNEAIRVEQHSTFLPDCRAYEQVSPVDKNGSDVAGFSADTRASATGDSVQYPSSGGFGDVRGSGTAFEYFAHRGESGWVTHAITPEMPSSTANAAAGLARAIYDGEFSSDFTKGVFSSPKPLNGTPASVSGVENLYLRDDLATPGAGHYQLLTACPRCEEPGGDPLAPLPSTPNLLEFFLPHLAGNSPDMSHVAFESIENLTNEAPPQPPPFELFPGFDLGCGSRGCAPRLYEFDNGTLHLAGILPGGEAADASFAGTGASNLRHTPHVVSNGSDGHTRIEFTQPTTESGETFSQLGLFEQFLFQGTRTGNLFQRIDGAETIELNESERTEAPSSPFAPAEYLDASADGERVFFATNQALTNDAVPGTRQIYMYDASKPASSPSNLTLVSRPGEATAGLIGLSSDGHYAYFYGDGRLKVWHEGTLKGIARSPLVAAEYDLDGEIYSQTQRQSRVTPDGRHLIWVSDRSPVTGLGFDHGTCPNGFGCLEVYVYSAETGQVSCASCDSSGALPTDSATTNATYPFLSDTASHENRAISVDGRYVFFNSPDPLVHADTNGKLDAYEYDTYTGKVSLLSSGTSPANSYLVESDEEGANVFIATRDPLVGYDTDNAYDLYDVRVNGGYPEPPATPAVCEGETCQGSQAPPPAVTPVGSTLQGRGNLPLHRGCPKGRHAIRRHGRTRCVKSRKHGRTAMHNRRASR